MRQLTVGSLFAGIGGIDLGLERAGMRVRWQCELDAFCRGVLHAHWPDVPCYRDIHHIGADILERVDVLAGGFPCQPVSQAGRRRGQDDPRWLWPEYARLIGELRPAYVLGENVRGLCSKGLDEVLGDLAGLGYDAEWQVVSASAVGAPHLRERVFIVAYPNAGGDRREGQPQRDGQPQAREQAPLGSDADGLRDPLSDADGEGRTDSEGRPGPAWPDRRTVFGPDAYTPGPHVWAPEPNVGRVADGVPRRVDRLRALGNAVVPQVAEYVGGLIVADAERLGFV